jgi:hypothetical protein
MAAIALWRNAHRNISAMASAYQQWRNAKWQLSAINMWRINVES